MQNFISEGFSYYPEFISEEEENSLLIQLKRLNWQKIVMYKQTAKRKVVHFGFNYSYSTRKIEPTITPPAFLYPLINRCAILLKVEPEELAEVLITEYPLGAQIGWHRDAAVFDTIVGISLGSACTIKFRQKMNALDNHFTAILEPRSAYILANSVREEWEHTIPPVKNVRYSITLRTLKTKDKEREGRK